MKKSVAVKLAGHTLHLKTEDDPNYVRSVANYLAELIDEIRNASGGAASAHQVALLAGLRVSDELFKAQKQLDALRGSINTRVSRVMDLLEDGERER
ncbi:MAG: cell division protein ZapA [Myxococcales bacterium]|nr:cell division protein ZapA [Myxococcales bacterium]